MARTHAQPISVSERVAPRGLGAPHEPGQHLRHRVLSAAGSGLCGTPMDRGALGMECINPRTGRSACATRDGERNAARRSRNQFVS